MLISVVHDAKSENVILDTCTARTSCVVICGGSEVYPTCYDGMHIEEVK